jgi:hypothetical protein
VIVRIWGALGDFAYDQVVATEFLVTTGGSVVNKAITEPFSAIRIEAKRQGGTTGTLSTTVFLTDILVE